MICLVSTLGIYYFFFQSSIPMRAELVVGRGTARITESDLIGRAVPRERNLTNLTATVSTDAQTQVTLSFREPDEQNRLLAAVTLKRNSMLNLGNATLPRYEWSNSNYQIEL